MVGAFEVRPVGGLVGKWGGTFVGFFVGFIVAGHRIPFIMLHFILWAAAVGAAKARRMVKVAEAAAKAAFMVGRSVGWWVDG